MDKEGIEKILKNKLVKIDYYDAQKGESFDGGLVQDSFSDSKNYIIQFKSLVEFGNQQLSLNKLENTKYKFIPKEGLKDIIVYDSEEKLMADFDKELEKMKQSIGQVKNEKPKRKWYLNTKIGFKPV